MNPTRALSDSTTLEQELLRLLADQGRRVPFPLFVGAVMIAAVVSDVVPLDVWAPWLTLVVIVLVVRWQVLTRLPTLSSLSEKERLRIAIGLSAINGITHGLSVIFFVGLPEYERAIQSFLLVGLCTGAVATTAGYMPVFLAYLIPSLGSLTLAWALSAPSDSHWVVSSVNPNTEWFQYRKSNWIHHSMAFVIALFGLLLVALARDAFRLFRQSYEIRLQHVELNNQLKTALDEGEAIRLQQLGLNVQLEAALDRAEAASRAKTRFLASASHDLRQPMHTLSLFGAALALRPLDGRSREIAQHMNTALQTLTSQMDALLDISKLDAGVVPVNQTRIQLSSFLKRIDPEFATAARAKGLRWRVRCPLGIFIETDEFLFERVIRNLLDNAIKYTRSGHVSVSAVAASHGVALRISDSGRGIATEDQQQVFEEFFQGENPERDRTRGLGLGLAIVRRLENLLQIKIDMESAPGRGTTFCIALPLASGAAIAVAPSAPAPLGTKHILIIDDETMVQLGMQTLLEEMGCSASLADGTANAVAAARAIKPDVVVADLRLRGTDSGIAAVDAIRKVYPKMPAIFISGETAPEKLREAEGTGIMLLHKPVAIEILRKAIGDVCNG